MFDLFISYPRGQSLALAFAERCDQLGLTVWLDRQQRSSHQTSVAQKLFDGISHSLGGVAFIDARYFQSYWTQTEFRAMWERCQGSSWPLAILWCGIDSAQRREFETYFPVSASMGSEEGIGQAVRSLGLGLLDKIESNPGVDREQLSEALGLNATKSILYPKTGRSEVDPCPRCCGELTETGDFHQVPVYWNHWSLRCAACEWELVARNDPGRVQCPACGSKDVDLSDYGIGTLDSGPLGPFTCNHCGHDEVGVA